MKEKNTEIKLRIKDVISQEPKDIHTIAQEIKVEELSVLKATRELMEEG